MPTDVEQVPVYQPSNRRYPLAVAGNLTAALPLLKKHTLTAHTVTYIITQRAADGVAYRTEVMSSAGGIKCIHCGPADGPIDESILEVLEVDSLIVATQRIDGLLKVVLEEGRATMRGYSGAADKEGALMLVVCDSRSNQASDAGRVVMSRWSSKT